MLEDVEAGEDAKIVSWMPSGNAFKVHDTQAFAQKIIPKWFKQKCYKSFLRQLHLYGFQRVSDGPERGKTTKTSLVLGCPLRLLQTFSGFARAGSPHDSAFVKLPRDDFLKGGQENGALSVCSAERRIAYVSKSIFLTYQVEESNRVARV